MSNEEVERLKEFILSQQAKFATDIQKLQESQTKTEQLINQTEQLVNRLAAATLEGFKDVNTKIDALVDSHIRLSESQDRTDEALRNLIAVVDRYFRERNGRSED